MDQPSAHLDRGWDLVQRGDTRGAEASRPAGARARSGTRRRLTTRSAFVAALEGEGEEAIEAYRQAIALDDTYLEAMLNAAEVYIHPLGDFDQAIEMRDQALDLAEVDEEIIDALLLKFDALLGKGDLTRRPRSRRGSSRAPTTTRTTPSSWAARSTRSARPTRPPPSSRRQRSRTRARRGPLLPRPHPRRAGRCPRGDAGLPALP